MPQRPTEAASKPMYARCKQEDNNLPHLRYEVNTICAQQFVYTKLIKACQQINTLIFEHKLPRLW